LNYINYLKSVFLVFGLFLLFCSFSCKTQSLNEPEIVELNKDEIIIMDAIINSILTDGFIKILNDTQNSLHVIDLLYVDNYFEDSCGCFEEELAGHEYTYESMVRDTERNIKGWGQTWEIDTSTIEMFIVNNIETKRMDINSIQFESNVIVVHELSHAHHTWITFSSIGFNKDNTEALIFYSIKFLGSLRSIYSSYGKYVRLVNENGVWSIKNDTYAFLGG